jgi:DNA-binding response OmpR family regulator
MSRSLSKRILVVEDDAEMRHLFDLLLSGDGHEVVACANGAEALSLNRKKPFDLIILELLLTEHDGFETLIKLRRMDSPPKIIVTTRSSWTSAEVFFKMAKQLGAHETLAKPFTADQFLGIARKLLAAEK